MRKNTCKSKQQTPAFNWLLAFFIWPVYLPYYFLTISSGSTLKCNVAKRGKRGKRGKVGKRGEKGQKGERGNASNPVNAGNELSSELTDMVDDMYNRIVV